MHIGILPLGTKGFDCNEPVSQSDARAFYQRDYRFAVRYVPRITRKINDISAAEYIGIMLGGLSVMLVQHVDHPGWSASSALGEAYGRVAALEAKLAGAPPNTTLWCDLEEVSPHSTPAEVAGFCNSWYDKVLAFGYEPGLYVGFGCGLSATELYTKLKFKRYWAAYNLNADRVPAVRGIQMKQTPYPPISQRVAGISYQYDENIIRVDSFGGTPTLLIP